MIVDVFRNSTFIVSTNGNIFTTNVKDHLVTGKLKINKNVKLKDLNYFQTK